MPRTSWVCGNPNAGLIERFFRDRPRRFSKPAAVPSRVTLGLWELGYCLLTAFDFAEELVDQAQSLAIELPAGGPDESPSSTPTLPPLSMST